jgi:hypothetical protein
VVDRLGPDRDGVGTIGVLCGARTVARIVRKTPAGPLHKAVCNRWHGHDGPHTMTRGRDFARMAEWGEEDCEQRDYKEIYRIERATSERATR